MTDRPSSTTGESSEGLPLVGVVVLNWNSAWFTRRCLESVRSLAYPADRLRVVLVDNGSIDGSLEQLSDLIDGDALPAIELVANDANLGFAEGCNRGIRELLRPGARKAEWVALLNNDAWCEADWLRELVRVGESEPSIGAVASELLLDPGFLPFDIEAGTSDLEVERVELLGAEAARLDVTGALRTSGFSDEGALEWPARRVWRLAPGAKGRLWIPVGDDAGEVHVSVVDSEGSETLVRSVGAAPRELLVNGIGTGINDSGEGFDIGYGEPLDEVDASTEREVEGFCGGAALLRSDALEEVGLFDPRFFAYYEDTDLSWRLRRAGWRVFTAPSAIAHHAFGASGGGGSRLHVYLDRRNWMLTNLRNGDSVERRRAASWFGRATWRLFRVNVFGRARRGQRVQWQPLSIWVRAAVSALWSAPYALLGRRRERPGQRPTEHVRSLLQPGSSPRAPSPTPGGPLLTYVDVGETLKAGYRAGIQRVVCRLVAELPAANDRIQLVPIRWCERNQAYRRITSFEYESLLRSGAAAPVVDSVVAESAKSTIRTVLGRLHVISMVRRVRELVFGRGRRRVEDALVLDTFEPGSLLLELDAVWNEREVDRAELLAAASERGVRIATFVHDLFPLEHPEWFSRHLLQIFVPTVRAQLRYSDLLVCATESTAEQIRRVANDEMIAVADVTTIPLGADPSGGTASRDPSGARPHAGTRLDSLGPVGSGDPFLLVVGTVETRKNHALVLDAFDMLNDEFQDLHLVVVGRYGWGAQEFVERYESHPLAGSRLWWFPDAGDHELEALFGDAHTVLVPSIAEGFGLPVAEALLHGVPVLASSHDALVAVGGEAAEYLPSDDPAAWRDAIAERLGNDVLHQQARRRAADFEPPLWSESARVLGAALVSRFG